MLFSVFNSDRFKISQAGAPTREFGAKTFTFILKDFCQKLHGIKRNWTDGDASLFPLCSTHVIKKKVFINCQQYKNANIDNFILALSLEMKKTNGTYNFEI